MHINEINETVGLDAKYAHRQYDHKKDLIYTGLNSERVVKRGPDGHFWLRVKGKSVQVCNEYLERKLSMRNRTLKMSLHPGRKK